jgi:hypothetical protein
MSDTSYAQQISVDVIAACAQALDAVRQQDLSGMVAALRAAVCVYEQHPSQVHEPVSHLGDVLAWIRAGRSLCASLGRSDLDFAVLEDRAEALRRPLQ